MLPMEDPLLTSEDVAGYLNVDVVTVRRLVSRGELAAYRVGSEFRFSQQDVSDYLKRQYVPARPAAFTAASAGIRVETGPFGYLARALQIGIEVGRDRPKQSQEERFTPHAAQALTHSDEIARQARSEAIGPLHLLLGLALVREGVAAQALNYFGVTDRQVREALGPSLDADATRAAETEAGAPPAPTIGAEVKQALAGAVKEARRLKHDYLGTEHLLLGLLRDEKGPAAELLRALNAPAERVRAHLLEMIKGSQEVSSRQATVIKRQPVIRKK